jgi:H+/gluconate symporter-like permease
MVNIFNNEIPLFGPVNSATWALVNLILSILGAVMALLVAIRAILLKKKKNDKDDQNKNRAHEDEENDENVKRNRLAWLITTIVSGVVGVLVFLFTEDTSNEMVLVDIWTIVNAVVFAIGIVATIFTVKRVKKDDDKDSRQGPTSGSSRVISLSGK